MGKIIYIAGYSRSGSTILDMLLGAHSEIFGTGELAYFPDDIRNPERQCSCGEKYCDCEFWSELVEATKMDSETAKKLHSVESHASLKELLSGQLDSEVMKTYKTFQKGIFAYIRQKTGKSIVLDSSKSARSVAGRFVALSEIAEEDVRIIHLVRDSRSTMQSYYVNGSNWRLESHGPAHKWPVARAAVGWRLANQNAAKLGAKFGSRYMLLRYEDLLREPERQLDRIGKHVDINVDHLKDIVRESRPLVAGHNVGGNRVRLKPVEFKLDPPKLTNDLPFRYKLIHACVAGKLNRKLVAP